MIRLPNKKNVCLDLLYFFEIIFIMPFNKRAESDILETEDGRHNECMNSEDEELKVNREQRTEHKIQNDSNGKPKQHR